MSTRRYGLAFLLALLLLALTAAGCSEAETAPEGDTPAEEAGGENGAEGEEKADGEKKKNANKGEDGEEEDEEQAVPVEVVTLGRGAIESVLRSSSTLEAERQVKVYAEAARLVRQLLVEEGDRVRKGQVLLRLQDEQQRNNLASVRNELEKAEREYELQQRLYSEQLISEETFNEATFDLEQLRIRLADADRELGYTEVNAPITGTVTQRLVNLGDQVSVGQHLFDIVDFDSLVARVYVPEKHLKDLRPGLPARVTAQALGARQSAGKVLRIAPIVDARTGTIKVTVDVGGRTGLRPGMYVDVALVTATRGDAVLVPKRALVYDSDQMFVFRLLDDRRVERVFIEPLLSDKLNIEPAAGLEEGDQLVVAGQAGLKEGALVSLPEDEQAEEAAADDEDAAVERASV